MTDILIGVIVGGFIASIIPIVTLLTEHRRLKQNLKLKHLLEERQGLEDKFKKNLNRFTKAIRENSYSSDMINDFNLTMPEEVSEIFKKFLADPNKTKITYKKTYMGLVLSMRKSLSDIDEKIEKLVFKK